MAMRMEEEEEEERKEKEKDSDVEDITVLLWRKMFATHLNGKLVEVRLRVSSSSSSTPTSEKDLCVHVKIMEPKSRKIARIAVLGKQLSRLQRGSAGLDAARRDPESPLHDDVLEGIAIVQQEGQETTVACARAAANVFGALYDAYEPRYWWFEAIIMMQKAMLTGGLVLVGSGRRRVLSPGCGRRG